MTINPVDLRYPSVFTCCSCDKHNLKGWHVSNVPKGTREGYYCEPCYNFDIKPLTKKPMTSIQEQHQLASEWHAEMAAKGTAFEVEWREKGMQLWKVTEEPTWRFYSLEYRRKPTPKLTPWTFEDITTEIAGAWFRGKGYHAFGSGVIFEKDGIQMSRQMYIALGVSGQNHFLTYNQALEQLEYSTDLKTWKPCGKVSE